MAPDPDMTDIFLLPGDYFVGGAGHRIRTLLGSCVSITLWHRQRKVGAMSHFLLSSRNQDKRGDKATTGLNGRYGEDALELMLSRLRAMGVEPKECQAKIFGGGQMFPGMTPGIGRQNGEVALRLLQAHGIAVVSESLYGVGHRNIIFDIATGHVWSRHVAPGQAAEVAVAPMVPMVPVVQPGQAACPEHAALPVPAASPPSRAGLLATLARVARQQAAEALTRAAQAEDAARATRLRALGA